MARKVLVFGTFDVIHPGHISFLKQARERGELLSAIVARDSTVEKIKNHKPLKNEEDRLEDLKRSGLVDEARLGNKGGNPYSIIKDIRPDVICLGYDQYTYVDGLAERLAGMGLKAEIYRMEPFGPEKYHSGIINRAVREV